MLNCKSLARKFLPGKTPLSISKTVDVLVNEKIQKDHNSTKIGEKNG